MSKRAGACFVVMALVLLFMSCTRIDAGKRPEEGGIASEKLEDVTSIPSKWGKLISVSHRPDFENVFQLWFQDEDGNLSMVVYNMNTNRLIPDIILIPQK